MGFYTHLKWKRLVLLLWATAPLCSAAQLRALDLPSFTYQPNIPLPHFGGGDEPPPPPNSTDSTNGLRQSELPSNRFQLKSALQQLFVKLGVRTRSQLVRVALEEHASLWGSRG